MSRGVKAGQRRKAAPVTLNLRLPVGVLRSIKRIARFAGTDTATVIRVAIAVELVRGTRKRGTQT